MSTDIVEYISGIVTQNIQPPLLQIANSEFVKYINTGDRIKDSAYVLVLNSLLLILIKIFYKLIHIVYSKFKPNNNFKDGIDTEKVCEEIGLDKVIKYKFRIDMLFEGYCMHKFTEWLSYRKVKLNTSQTTVCKLTKALWDINGHILIGNLKENQTILGIMGGEFKHCYTPVHKYNYNNKTEYIFMIGTSLYSNDLDELEKFVRLYTYEIETTIYCRKNATSIKIYELNYEKFTPISLGDINKNITFDTIYFDGKDHIMEWVNKFRENKMYPKGLSLVNKLGILLYGPPGTGKTGMICALANYLNREILMVNALNIKNDSQNKLKEAIHKCKDTHIIVFDEFDYILKSTIPLDDDFEKYSDLLKTTSDMGERKNLCQLIQSKKREYNDTNLDHRFILSLLDGIGNDTNRIIVATTNNPENINSAFLRPGRFDVIQKLGFCSFAMFKNIISTKYDTLTENFFETRKQEIEEILSLNITPLILINNLVCSKDIDELFELLKKLKQQTYDKSIE